MKMAKIVLPKRSGKRKKVREKSLKSQGILKNILSGNPVLLSIWCYCFCFRSRLGCQIIVSKDMDGLVVRVPSGVADAREPS